MARIPPIEASSIWDLGCGTGHLTVELASRWPDASVTGLDQSEAMLERARRHEGPAWVQGDIAGWSPDVPADIVFSNAALHWVDDHDRVVTRLTSALAPGGVLAVQVPRNFDEPTHRILADLAAEPRWRDRVGHLAGPPSVLRPEDYHELLRSKVTALDVWETTYHHALTGDDPVTEWVRGAAARPFLDVLGPDGDDFLAEYGVRARSAYPRREDGVTLLAFRRLFFVAIA